MAQGTCGASDCETYGRLARGWCLSCYSWSQNHGGQDPSGRPRKRKAPADGQCTVVEDGVKCALPYECSGMCTKHRTRVYRYGDALTLHGVPNGTMRTFLEAAAYAETDECVIPLTRTGQWNVNTGDGLMSASRFVWILRHGAPGTAHILHSCNGGSGANGCVNIRHLRKGTNSENVLDRGDAGVQVGEDHHNSRLKEEQVRCIRERAAAGETHQALADEYGVVRQTVTDVVARRTWRRLS